MHDGAGQHISTRPAQAAAYREWHLLEGLPKMHSRLGKSNCNMTNSLLLPQHLCDVYCL